MLLVWKKNGFNINNVKKYGASYIHFPTGNWEINPVLNYFRSVPLFLSKKIQVSISMYNQINDNTEQHSYVSRVRFYVWKILEVLWIYSACTYNIPEIQISIVIF